MSNLSKLHTFICTTNWLSIILPFFKNIPGTITKIIQTSLPFGLLTVLNTTHCIPTAQSLHDCYSLYLECSSPDIKKLVLISFTSFSNVTFSCYHLIPSPSAPFSSFQLYFPAPPVISGILYILLIGLFIQLISVSALWSVSSLRAGDFGLFVFTAILPAPGIMPGTL